MIFKKIEKIIGQFPLLNKLETCKGCLKVFRERRLAVFCFVIVACTLQTPPWKKSDYLVFKLCQRSLLHWLSRKKTAYNKI